MSHRSPWLATVLAACGPGVSSSPATAPVVTLPPTPDVPASVRERPPPPPPAEAWDEVRPAAAYLGDGVHDEEPRRTRLLRFGAVRAHLDGERLNAGRSPEDAYGARMTVVEEAKEWVRIVYDSRDVRLVLYVSRADLHLVAPQRIRVNPHEARAPIDHGEDGIWLRAGRRVDAAVTDGMHAVLPEADTELSEMTAYVRHRDVAQVFVPPPESPPEGTAVVLEGAVPILDGRQRTIVRLPPGRRTVRRLQRDAKRVRVRLVDATYWVEGWVDDRHVHPAHGRLGRSHRARPPRVRLGGKVLYLHRGDRLHADGEPIGVVKHDRLQVHPVRVDAEGAEVRLPGTRWGSLRVDVDARDLAYGEAWEHAYAQRVRIEPRAGEPPLPWHLPLRRDEVDACWGAALAKNPTHPAVRVDLTWKTDKTYTVRRPRLDPELRSCLTEALFRSYVDAPLQPLDFVVELAPTPYPER